MFGVFKLYAVERASNVKHVLKEIKLKENTTDTESFLLIAPLAYKQIIS